MTALFYVTAIVFIVVCCATLIVRWAFDVTEEAIDLEAPSEPSPGAVGPTGGSTDARGQTGNIGAAGYTGGPDPVAGKAGAPGHGFVDQVSMKRAAEEDRIALVCRANASDSFERGHLDQGEREIRTAALHEELARELRAKSVTAIGADVWFLKRLRESAK